MSIAMLRGGKDHAAYYVERAASCQPADYYVRELEPAGQWVGRGAERVGLEGPISGEGQAAQFAGLLDGTLPDGTRVARQVMRADPRSLLPARPLTTAIRRQLADSGGELSMLFPDPSLARKAANLLGREAASTLKPGAAGQPVIDVRVVADLASAAGLNPHVLYPASPGAGGFTAAFAHAGKQADMRRAALDVVVSAPKSVSVVFGLGNPATAAVVTAAHERAVSEALGYLDRHAGHGLRGHQGGDQRATRIDTDGLIAARFTHHTSRADDPQLHTHLVVANLLHGVDGKWSAVDSRAMHRHARTAGCVYQAVLRGELTRTLGVDWGPIRRGVAEIKGVPNTLIREFSTRRLEIETELDRTGSKGRRAAQRAAYVTRSRKSQTPEAPLRARWAARAAELGHSAEQVLDRALGRTPVPRVPSTSTLAAEVFGPDGVTAQATSFDRRDLIQALTETLPAGAPVTALMLEAAADRLLGDDAAIPLARASDAVAGRRWTTQELLAAEDRAFEAAEEFSHIAARSVEQAVLAVEGRGLSAEQQAVVTGLLSSPALVDVVSGPAGSGKTAALRAAADAWRGDNIPVVGCSLAAVTARRLETATGVRCASIARLIAELDRADPATGYAVGLAPLSVVLVDEASMVGTRHISRLLTHVDAVGGKLVLVGDPAQLSEIDAGGMFAALARYRDPLLLTGNQRQVSGWEREALTCLRDGNVDLSLDYYLANGRVHVTTNERRSRDQLATAYVEQTMTDSDPYSVVALASTREDTADMNTTIRAKLRDAGRLGPDAATVIGADGPRRYAAGDLVVVTRNDHQVGLLNGTRAVLAGASAGELRLRTDTGAAVSVPTGWAADHLDHGYALTVHKAQGVTARVALLYGTGALNQQAGYVGLSRGTEANHLYTSYPSLISASSSVEVGPFELLGPDPDEVALRLAERLAVNRRHVLASDQQPAPSWQTSRRSRSSYAEVNDLYHQRPSGRDMGRSR